MKQTEFFFHLLLQSAHLYEYWTDAAMHIPFVLKFLLDEPTFPFLISASLILHIATVESPTLTL